uniref:Major capsid protein N-terminal domain-containing protein n=1 Tax=viral metagenome TaxID=1070528 RepID=A0A6C0IT88_9ZZZZ
MPGGLMNLVSQGQQNIVLNGNPSKSFFKCAYRQYTNFGLQKFRVDFEGSKTLRLSEESSFTFKIPRYADLLMDCYLSVALPNIWSPILPPQQITPDTTAQGLGNIEQWAPYEFKWIDNIGAKMIKKISITCGNYTLQEYSGDYLLASVQRDFNDTKKDLFLRMIGQTPELTDPANANGRINSYPNAYYTGTLAGPEPSIRGRILYIPLNSWFGLKSEMSFPLTSLQYNELHVNVTLRPINEIFTIRDVFDATNNYPYIAPNFNSWYMQFYRFLQPPPDVCIDIDSYSDQRTLWNTDIHLNCTYCFLSNEEERLFALQEQKYLMKQVHEQIFTNVTGPNRIDVDSLGMVSNWLFYFQRSDANLRNEWSNYTNWPYSYVPINVFQAPTNGTYIVYRSESGGVLVPVEIGPGVNPDGTLTGLVISPPYNPQNDHLILIAMGILLDGAYRENIQPSGVYDYIEKYTRTTGNAPPGLYCYNFGIHSNNSNLQPSGAINMSRFTQIELEFTTIIPPLDPMAQSLTICDPETGQIIGINKPTWRIYDYNFNLHLFEERINIITFTGGNAGLMYAT